MLSKEHDQAELQHQISSHEEPEFISFENFDELFSYMTEHEEEFSIILDYNEFQVWQHHETDCYYYFENDGGGFCEMELCAVLTYDQHHDLQIPPYKTGHIMHKLFKCDCCGECLLDDGIEYMWFKKI